MKTTHELPAVTSRVESHGKSYGPFDAPVYGEIRHEALGEDLGQTSWLTRDEHDAMVAWLRLGTASQVLDVGCGTGGPSLLIAHETHCTLTGIDIESKAVALATEHARMLRLEERVRFEVFDAGMPLRFPDGRFEAIVSLDTVNHLPDRRRTLEEWWRVLAPGGRIVYTDPSIVKGSISSSEIAVRSLFGFCVFVPDGENERLISAAGFEHLHREDSTHVVAEAARRWERARLARVDELRAHEDYVTFEALQRFFHVTHVLASERRLSRMIFVAEKRRR